MKQILFVILLLIQAGLQAQTANDTFNKVVFEVKGDLNKDNIEDKIIVTQDTINENAPYRIQIFFAKPDGKFDLIATSTKLIEPQYPNGRDGFITGTEFSEITIKNGVISVNSELTRGHFEHKFRYQNGNFELIGFSEVYSDGISEISTTDFNLSTGNRIEKLARYDIDKVISNKKKKILIRPLPKFQDVEPFETDLY